MTTQTEALKLALEALELHLTHHEHGCVYLDPAVTAIKEALAQPEQEPVAWANLNALSEQINSVNCGTVYRLPSEAEGRQPLYTTPPQRKPLTDEELRNLWAKHAARQHDWPNDCTPPVRDIGNGLRFECDWHESEYQVFKAGFKAAHGIKE